MEVRLKGCLCFLRSASKEEGMENTGSRASFPWLFHRKWLFTSLNSVPSALPELSRIGLALPTESDRCVLLGIGFEERQEPSQR